MDESRRMTVLQILPALRGGGVERGVLEVAGALVAAGHRSLVISAGGPMVRELVGAGSEHFAISIGVKSPRAILWIAELRRFLLEQQVDVVDYHSRLPGWVALAAWKSLPANKRPALVSTLHGLHSTGRYSSVMCRGQWVIAVSDTVRQYVEKNYAFAVNDRLRVIHRGVDNVEFPRNFHPDAEWLAKFQAEHRELEGRKLVTIVGRMTRLKGHIDFLKLIRGLLDRGQPVHGMIVGGFDPRKEAYNQQVLKQIQSLGLRDHVVMLGQRNDLKELYSVSDCVVSLSKTPESFGRTVAEALSIGVPVVGYGHGGVAEILAAQFPFGKCGFEDIEQLVDKTDWVLANNCRELIQDNPFALDFMLRRTLELYLETQKDQTLSIATVQESAA